jgi:DNA-binding response OmpR family regulator
MEEELLDFSNSGADLVLTKPLKPRTLAILIKSFQENGSYSRLAHGQRLEVDDEHVVWVARDGRYSCFDAGQHY